MKILMLILASDGGKNDIYTKLQKIMKTYIHSNPMIEAYFYKANPNISEDYVISGDTIYVKTQETYPNLWKKFWLVLKAFENRLDEFTFIARPNLSTFLVIDRYLKHLETLPTTLCCSGLQFFGGGFIPFPSGYLFTITPDLAKQFIYNYVIQDNEGIDDRCVGLILNELDIPIISHNKCIELNNTELESESVLNAITNDETIFMIRIRNLVDCDYSVHPFGLDDEERVNKDLTMHFTLLKEIYNIEEICI